MNTQFENFLSTVLVSPASAELLVFSVISDSTIETDFTGFCEENSITAAYLNASALPQEEDALFAFIDNHIATGIVTCIEVSTTNQDIVYTTISKLKDSYLGKGSKIGKLFLSVATGQSQAYNWEQLNVLTDTLLNLSL